MKSIAIINQKGGVAKTTSALNLGAQLAKAGKKVLLIDLDAQFSATSAVFGKREFELSAYDILLRKAIIPNVVQYSENFGFDMVPSDIMLSAIDLSIAQEIGRERILSKQLVNLKYDVVIMDCPPSLGLVSVNALTAAQYVIVTVCPEYFSLRGIRLLEKIIADVEHNLITEPLSKRVLVTRFKDRIITKEAEETIRSHFGNMVFTAVIPENIKIEEAHNAHLPVGDYDPNCKGSKSYKQLSEEVIKWLKI